MKKELDAKYYDSVVSKNKTHAAKWKECGRRGNIVILEKVVKHVDTSKIEADGAAQSKGLDMPEVRESERSNGEGMQPRYDILRGGAVNSDHPKRRGRPSKKRG